MSSVADLQTNKQTKEHWRSIVNSLKNCTDHLYNYNTPINFSIMIFVDVILRSFFRTVLITITISQILQLSFATLISNDYLKKRRNKPGFGAFSIINSES